MEFEIINRKDFLLSDGCHPTNSLLYIIEGEFYCKINNKEYYAKKGDIFVFPKDIYFKRRVISQIKCVFIQFEEYPLELDAGILKIIDTIRAENNFMYIEKLVNVGDLEAARYFICDFFNFLKQENILKKDISSDIQYVIDYYQNNYSDPISLTTLANNIHASKQTLISKFRKELGITPNAFLIKVRLNQSKQLLTHSNMSVGEISSSCGFENMYYFSNTFKKHFGISPSNYRNKFVL